MKRVGIVLGLLVAGCSTGEAPSDLQYDPTVQAALAQSVAARSSPCGRGLFADPPSFLDDSQSSPDSPAYKPQDLEGAWQISQCEVYDPSGKFMACQQNLTLSQEGNGHIVTDDGLAFLVGGLTIQAGGTFPAALILQRVHAMNGGCAEDHIRQTWLYLDQAYFTDPTCAMGGGKNCTDAIVFDVVVGSTCQSVGAWTCTTGVLIPRNP